MAIYHHHPSEGSQMLAKTTISLYYLYKTTCIIDLNLIIYRSSPGFESRSLGPKVATLPLCYTPLSIFAHICPSSLHTWRKGWPGLFITKSSYNRCLILLFLKEIELKISNSSFYIFLYFPLISKIKINSSNTFSHL